MSEGSPNEDVVIDLQPISKKKELVESFRKQVEESYGDPSHKQKCTIHRVPPHLREGDKSAAYHPQIISIGPYHHGDQGLEAMEEHKRRSLHEFLLRNRTISLEAYLDEVQALEAEARSCYSGEIELKSDEFVWMMLLDGSFIVQLFLKRVEEVNELIYCSRWMLPLITSDILLLQNQLPFFILQRLFELAMPERDPTSLKQLAIGFFKHLLPGDENTPPEQPVHHLLHLLHLFHSRRLITDTSSNSNRPPPVSQSSPPKSTLGKMEVQVPEPESKKKLGNLKWKGVVNLLQHFMAARSEPPPPPPTQKSIPGAVELHEAGVKFRVKKNANSYLEVTFHNGVMEIPYLLIKEPTNTLFRNFIAYEQCHPESDCHFTSYAFFMDCIVNTPEDVALLSKYKIIEHWLGDDESVALLFNSLCSGVAIDTQTRHYFPKLFKEVRDYCKTNWHTWRARLMHDYFSNPWAIISLVAAIILLILTFTQTVFSVLAYVRPP